MVHAVPLISSDISFLKASYLTCRPQTPSSCSFSGPGAFYCPCPKWSGSGLAMSGPHSHVTCGGCNTLLMYPQVRLSPCLQLQQRHISTVRYYATAVFLTCSKEPAKSDAHAVAI